MLFQAAKVCPSCSTSWPYVVPKAEALHIEEDNEPPQESQRATSSKRKKRRANIVIEDEDVGSSNQDELNGLTRKASRARRANVADTGGPSASQSSATSAFRRVTRRSSQM